MGWTNEELASLHDPVDSIGVPERAALKFADMMTLDPHGVTDDIFGELRRYFDEGQVIELAAVVGLFNYFNRFNDALRMESSQ